MSVQLYLHLAEPAVAPVPVSPGDLAGLIRVIESLWPATSDRIAEHLGISRRDADALLERGIARGLVRREGRCFHATDAALRALRSTRGAA